MDDNSLIRYISSMAQLRRMLSLGLITGKEFAFFEGQIRKKYSVPEKSIFRDYHLISRGLQR